MNEYKKNVFIAALVIYGVQTIKGAMYWGHTQRLSNYWTPSFDEAIADAEIFVTKILQRP